MCSQGSGATAVHCRASWKQQTEVVSKRHHASSGLSCDLLSPLRLYFLRCLSLEGCVTGVYLLREMEKASHVVLRSLVLCACMFTKPLSAVDCVGNFSVLDACSQTCGGGTQSLMYTVTTPALGTGIACNYSNGSTQTTACNVQSCGMLLTTCCVVCGIDALAQPL